MGIVIVTGRQCPDDVERLLGGLPMWFGIEESNRGYVEAARRLPTWVALDSDDVVGVCVVRHHQPQSSEIELLAVDASLHRRGIGRALVDAVEDDLRARGIRLLQVKTFGPSGESVEYERTRAFYVSMGYIPLEESLTIWGPDNPCLISVKPIG